MSEEEQIEEILEEANAYGLRNEVKLLGYSMEWVKLNYKLN
jgi:hypothetical protein